MIDCPDCGSTHMGAACGLTFAQRLGSVLVDESNFDTATKRNYFDREAIREGFGEGSKERLMDATKGLGAGRLDRETGQILRRDGDREVPVTDKELKEVYLGGPVVAET